MRFASPGAAEVLAHAQRLAAELDAGFLWEASGDGEFGFDELAREYYGDAPDAAQAAAVALLLQSSPMHFYKRGKGRYRKAPPDALKAALASVERKAREAEQTAAWVARACAPAGCPTRCATRCRCCCTGPTRRASRGRRVARGGGRRAHRRGRAARARAARIPSTHDYHFNRLLAEAFPARHRLPAARRRCACRSTTCRSPTCARSRSTTRPRPRSTTRSRCRCAPTAASSSASTSRARRSRCRAAARTTRGRARLSTVYMPGRKITMLPDDDGRRVHAARVGDAAGAVAVRRDGSGRPAGAPRDARRARADRREPAPLQHRRRRSRPTRRRRTSRRGRRSCARCGGSSRELAAARAQGRLRARRLRFYVDWDAPGARGEAGRVAIVPRARGSPLDKLVAELMIHVNATWGRLLAEAGVAGPLPRAAGGQGEDEHAAGRAPGPRASATTCGRARRCGATATSSTSGSCSRSCAASARRTTSATPSSSRSSPTSRRPTRSTASSRTGWSTTGACAGCCRKNVDETTARVMRDGLVRFDRLPLTRAPARGGRRCRRTRRVRVAIGAIDLLAETLECRFAGALAPLDPAAPTRAPTSPSPTASADATLEAIVAPRSLRRSPAADRLTVGRKRHDASMPRRYNRGIPFAPS